MKEFSDTSLHRMTVIAPMVLALGIYIALCNVRAVESWGAVISEAGLRAFVLVIAVALTCYLSGLGTLAVRSFDKGLPEILVYAARTLTASMPLMLAVLCAIVDSMPERNSFEAPLAMYAVGLSIIPIVVAALVTLVVYLGGYFLFLAPVRWMLGIAEPSPAQTHNANDLDDVIIRAPNPYVVREPAPPSQPDRAKTFEFDWTHPAEDLSGLAGMSELKAELSRVLAPFKTYASGRGAVSDRNGILLSGPPGNGKTAFAKAIAGELGLPFVKVSCQDIQSKWLNESPEMIKDLFRQAGEMPSVIFFDEFDGVGMRRDADHQHSENRKAVTALLSEIDDARSKRIVVIAATNYVEQLDPALIRDGRCDFRIEIPYPDLEARLGILKGLLKKFKLETSPEVAQRAAELWERRSVAFIEATVKRLRDQRDGKKGPISIEEFKQAAMDASRRASAIPKEGKRLSQIALTSDVRREADSLVYRLRNWEQIEIKGGEPPSGVLLYGPPGTGKTSFVRALARELGDWHVFEVNTAEILQNPRKFREVMELSNQHRPAIVFLDEADELLRDRMYSNDVTATNEVLKAMDGMMGKVPEVFFMAATNNTDCIDQAALRGGRFGEKIYMGPLQGDDLLHFIQLEFESKANVRFAPDLTPQTLAAYLQSATPADVLGLLRKAINYTFDQTGVGRPVAMADIDRAMQSQKIA